MFKIQRKQNDTMAISQNAKKSDETLLRETKVLNLPQYYLNN